MGEGQKALAALAILALYAVLLGVKLWPLWRRALRCGVVFCRRSVGEWLLLAAFLVVVVHRGATKDTNGNARASGPDPAVASQAEFGCPSRDAGDEFRFTAFSVDSNAVCFAASLSAALDLPEGQLDLFATHDVDTNVWALVGSCAVAPSETNLVVAVPLYAFPFPALDRLFLKLGTRADLDGDGLADARERLMYETSPWLADTDGDGLLDGEELAGVPPSDPLDHDTDGDGYPDGEERLAGTSPVSHDDGAGTTIRYCYDADDRLAGAYSGAATAMSAATLSPAGNPARQTSR